MQTKCLCCLKNFLRNFNHAFPQFSSLPSWLTLTTMSIEHYLRNKTCFPCLHSLVKTEANVWENLRADQWKPEKQLRIFACSKILKSFAEVFNRLWRHGQHVFFQFIKLFFSLLTKRKTMYEACTVNSHNS